jgi:peroxiredoxin
VVLGITFSAPDALKQWRDEVGSMGELLCDTDRAAAIAYGAADDAQQEKPSRISVLIGEDGRVVKTYTPTDAATHAAEVLADL